MLWSIPGAVVASFASAALGWRFEAPLLRQFISLYGGVDLPPESRIARYLDAARGAVASYEQIEREPEARIA